MKKEKRTFGRAMRWTWALTAAVLFHLALYWSVFWTRDSGQQLRRQHQQLTELQYFDAKTAERSEVLTQQMTLFDPRPLLLPTQWNAANATRLSDFMQEEAEIFQDYTPMFELEDGNYLDDFGNAAANYDRLTAAQVEFDFRLFDELGRESRSSAYEQEEGILVSMTSPATGIELSRATIYKEEVGDALNEWPGWRPATFLTTIEKGFATGGFSVLKSSGFEEVDQRLKRLAHSIFPELGPLRDGVYLLEITP